MINIDTKRLQTAFLPAGTSMFSDVMTKVAKSTDLSPSRRRDIKSGRAV